jgi:hypothetical protein
LRLAQKPALSFYFDELHPAVCPLFDYWLLKQPIKGVVPL